jgi:hypothetical protein
MNCLCWKILKGGCVFCREGTYSGHTGSILQLLCLGDHLLSLGSDGKLLLWKIGEYDNPQVHFKPRFCMHAHGGLGKAHI